MLNCVVWDFVQKGRKLKSSTNRNMYMYIVQKQMGKFQHVLFSDWIKNVASKIWQWDRAKTLSNQENKIGLKLVWMPFTDYIRIFFHFSWKFSKNEKKTGSWLNVCDERTLYIFIYRSLITQYSIPHLFDFSANHISALNSLSSSLPLQKLA